MKYFPETPVFGSERRSGCMKCLYCDGDTIDGVAVITCYSCGVRWDRGVVSVLMFDNTGKKWWWSIVPFGCLVIIDGRVAKEVAL
jgi:hypothetical protein